MDKPVNKKQDQISPIMAAGLEGFPCSYGFGDQMRQFVLLSVKTLADWQENKGCVMNQTDPYGYHPDIKSIIVQRISKPSLGHSPPENAFPLYPLKNCR